MSRSESITTLMGALSKAQDEFPPIKRDTINPHFHSKYATLDGVIDALQPTLRAHGLMIIQPAVSDPVNGYTGVTTILFHTSGEFLAETLLLPNAAPGGDKGGAQSATGAVTYARRTGYLSILGVSAADDDDGNTAAGGTTKTAQAPAKKVVPAKASTTPAQTQATLTPTSATTAAASTAATKASVPTAASGSSEMPSESEMEGYRNTFKLLGADLSTAGKLKPSTGLPINRKIIKYMLNVTNTKSVAEVTKEQWQGFLQGVSLVKSQPNGIQTLAAAVDEANGTTSVE